MNSTATLDATLAALSDPTRRAIIDRLARGPACVNDLAKPFHMSQQAISKHLAYLERAKLIEKRREGRRHFCTLKPLPMKEVLNFVEQYRKLWEERFDRLDQYLKTLQAREKKNAGKD